MARSQAGRESLLRRLTSVLDKTLVAHPTIGRDAGDLVRSGKRLRARLLFAAADGVERRRNDDLVTCAAAIELLHAASLVHDDIVDCSEQRRGLSALHCAIGRRNAAIIGSCLVQVGLELIASLPRAARARMLSASRDLARGQFAEIARRHDVRMLPADAMAIMRQKTGSVFALACELGGLLTDRDGAHCRRLRSVGRDLGIVFQIADDVDDLFGSPEELGRKPGSDLREGVISLPIAIALQREPESLRRIVGAQSGSHAVVRCRAIVARCGALGGSLRIAHTRAQNAQRNLSKLPPTGGTRWISCLLEATEQRIARHVDAASPRRQRVPMPESAAVSATNNRAPSYAR